MKQLIVMLAMIILGLALAGLIGNFNDTATDITDDTNNMIKQELSSGSGIDFN